MSVTLPEIRTLHENDTRIVFTDPAEGVLCWTPFIRKRAIRSGALFPTPFWRAIGAIGEGSVIWISTTRLSWPNAGKAGFWSTNESL
jgi:hypothetical protein